MRIGSRSIADLEARVSAAITTVGLTRNLDLQPATALSPAAGTGDSTAESGIRLARSYLVELMDRARIS